MALWITPLLLIINSASRLLSLLDMYMQINKIFCAGPLATRLSETIQDIQYGVKEGPPGWSVVVD